jgi:hypothetical protein
MQNLDNEALRQRVDRAVAREKRTLRIVFFAVSLIMFVLFVIISILMVGMGNIPAELMGPRNSPVLGPMIMLGMGWLTSLIFQGILLMMDFGAMDREIRSRAISREINQQLYEQMIGDAEKPKRHLEEDAAAYTVSDDGELVELDEEIQRKRAQS